jgi:hypothetical protein
LNFLFSPKGLGDHCLWPTTNVSAMECLSSVVIYKDFVRSPSADRWGLQIICWSSN